MLSGMIGSSEGTGFFLLPASVVFVCVCVCVCGAGFVGEMLQELAGVIASPPPLSTIKSDSPWGGEPESLAHSHTQQLSASQIRTYSTVKLV